MSGGIGFQKLNGQGTVATAQLTQLEQINNKLSGLLTPDLKAWFKLYFPDVPVIPYYRALSFVNSDSAAPQEILLGKRIYGECFIHVAAENPTGADSVETGCKMRCLLDADLVFAVNSGFGGQSSNPLNGVTGQFVGILNKVSYENIGSDEEANSGQITIRGFIIPDGYDISHLGDPDQSPAIVPAPVLPAPSDPPVIVPVPPPVSTAYTVINNSTVPRTFYWDRQDGTGGIFTTIAVGETLQLPQGWIHPVPSNFGIGVHVEVISDGVQTSDLNLLASEFATAPLVEFFSGHTYTTVYTDFVEHFIGEEYQGGIIIQLAPDKLSGLIISPADISALNVWSLNSDSIVGTSAAMGAGLANTDLIIASQGAGSYAAQLCKDLVLGGFNDWYLPSYDELDFMRVNQAVLTGLQPTLGEAGWSVYWSSTQYAGNTNNALFVDNFSTEKDNQHVPKTLGLNVRAFRSFAD